MLTITVLIGLAGYRLWRLVTKDTILDRPREWLDNKAWSSRRVERFTEMLYCPWCLGFWITGMLTAMAALSYDWSAVQVVLVWLAASAIAGLVAKLDPTE